MKVLWQGIILSACLSVSDGRAMRKPECASTIRIQPELSRTEFDSIHVLAAELNRATWVWIRQWMIDSRNPTPSFVIGAGEEIAPHLFRMAKTSGTASRRAMWALTWLMRGEMAGYSDGQAVLAASLYRAWELAPDGAMSLIHDPTVDAGTKLLAVKALASHWSDNRFETAATAALCILAARADGLLTALEEPSIARRKGIQADESLLILELGYAMDTALPTNRISSIINRLPPDNPVTQAIRHYMQTGNR